MGSNPKIVTAKEVGRNSITMGEQEFAALSAQSHSLFSFTRAFTIFFTSASGKGLSGGN